VTLLTPVRVTLYAVNLDEVLMSSLEKYVLANTTQGFSSVWRTHHISFPPPR